MRVLYFEESIGALLRDRNTLHLFSWFDFVLPALPTKQRRRVREGGSAELMRGPLCAWRAVSGQ